MEDLAGISAAVHLLHAGFNVDLYEASPKLGGRTYSFKDELTGDIIDNGQHILMGCYKDTLELADIIRAKENLIIERSLNINFVHKDFGIKQFRSISRIYPFNFASRFTVLYIIII